MRKENKKIAAAMTAVAVSFNALYLAPLASAAVCGFDGVTSGNLGGGDDGWYEEAIYTNCNNHNVRIKVNHFYASKERCVTPGESRLSADPEIGSLVGAEELGPC